MLIPKDALWRVAHCGQPDSELVRGKGPQRGGIPISETGVVLLVSSPSSLRFPPVVDSCTLGSGGGGRIVRPGGGKRICGTCGTCGKNQA